MKQALAGAAGTITGCLMGMSPVIYALLGLMIVDFISGVLCAYITKTISSEASQIGMAKKSMVILLVLAAEIGEHLSGIPFPAGASVAGAFCMYELISITENAAKAGIPLPSQITKALAKIEDN